MVIEIVINSCYGGFGLSEEAQRKLYEMKDPHMRAMSWKEYSGNRRGSVITEEDLADFRFLSTVALDEHTVLINGHEEVDRACPDLVKVVKELGSKANHRFSSLKIVSIPDATEWIISEYDGLEKVEEKHRSWR